MYESYNIIANYKRMNHTKSLARQLRSGLGQKYEGNDKQTCNHYEKLQPNHSFCFCQATTSYLSTSQINESVF